MSPPRGGAGTEERVREAVRPAEGPLHEGGPLVGLAGGPWEEWLLPKGAVGSSGGIASCHGVRAEQRRCTWSTVRQLE